MRPAAPVKMTSGMLAPRWLSGMAAYSSRYTYPCKRRTHAPSFPVAAQQSGVASRNLLTTRVGLLDSGSRASPSAGMTFLFRGFRFRSTDPTICAMLSERVYLDWNATAPLRKEARAAVVSALDVLGNPSSVHAEGRVARRLVENAREQVAILVNAEPRNVLFTSGGSE